MTVAVTGASGHIGGNLIRKLLDDGREVRVLVKDDSRAIDGLDVEIVRGDLGDEDSLGKLFDGAETVFHGAAKISVLNTDRSDVVKTNVDGARNVVNACIEKGVGRLVHFSSIHAFCSEPATEVIDEERDLVCSERFCYDWSKAAGQLEVMKGVDRGLDAVIVNPTGVIGPYDFKPSRMGEVLLDLYHNRLPALVNGGYNWVDVRDVVDGTLSAEKKGKTGECYLLSGHWKSMRELACAVTEITGRKTPGLVTPAWLCYWASYGALMWSKVNRGVPKFTPYAVKTVQSHRHISHKKASDELGYMPRHTNETIRDTLAWFEEAGKLES